MKNIRFFALLGALAVSACTKSSDDNSNPPNNSALVGSKWVVSYFFDKDKDETSDFAGYSFEFGSNGTLTA
ncbi:MAG: hypothetical protein JNK89_09030, partial [Saprospiraceae bacterium]|nr:hypothetical protein [Saprospiraceae bacterium]